jgi:anthranilate synthase component 1
MLNRNFKDFKFQHKRNKNQIIYTSRKISDDQEILNLINNFLKEKNSFIFESVEKGKIRGRYTIFGKNPDKIWEFNNKKSYLITPNNKKTIKGEPEKVIEKIIEEFKFKTPSELPPICSLISGYFSYDSIRYIEKIPNRCTDDLKLPDVRLLRPRTLIIHDNLKKKIFYIIIFLMMKKLQIIKENFLKLRMKLMIY